MPILGFGPPAKYEVKPLIPAFETGPVAASSAARASSGMGLSPTTEAADWPQPAAWESPLCNPSSTRTWSTTAAAE